MLEPEVFESRVDRIKELCGEGAPPRHKLRGATLRGEGRWNKGVALGPLPVRVVEKARSRPWGDLAPGCELPAPLPPPPKPTGWWALAATVAVSCGLMVLWMLMSSAPISVTPVDLSVKMSDGIWDLNFDTDDLATVDIIALRSGKLQLVHHNVTLGKGEWSSGHGRYNVVVAGEGAIVLSSPHGIDSIEMMLDAASNDPKPMLSFKDRVATLVPEADVAIAKHPRLR